jgi:signal peptidase I
MIEDNAAVVSSSDGGDEPRPDDELTGDDAGSGGGKGPAAALFAAVREVVLVLVIALGLSLLIKTFLVQAFFIPSASMENTLLIGDRVLVSKLTPGPFDLKRGDIVVFSDSGKWLGTAPDVQEGTVKHAVRSSLIFVGLLPQDSNEHLIKRLIGLPGDKVVCCDSGGRMTVNGVPVDEPYLFPGDQPSVDSFSVVVPPGRIWVMGDHRSDSGDSRYHQEDPGGGTVPLSDVVGKAFVKVWPLDRAGLLHSPTSSFKNVPIREPK